MNTARSLRSFLTISFILFVVLGLLYFFNIISLPGKNVTFLKTINGSFPVNLSNKSILTVSVTFEGTITEVREDEKGRTELITSIQGEGVPSFILTNDTDIEKRSITGEKTPATISDLDQTQRVLIRVSYNARTKELVTTQVAILP